MKIKFLLLTLLLLTVASISFAQPKTKKSTASKTAEIAPEQVVKNLYAARKSPKTDPFFQNKNRALLDKFFTRQLADLIWKDAISVKPGESGNLDYDPLYYAQDTDIKNFVIAKADENNVVKVTFKNYDKDEQILFTLVKENAASKVWKIDTIMYSDAEDLGSILEYGMMSEAEMKKAESENRLNGDYLVGDVKCSITTNISGYYARVKCDDQENFQVIDIESMTFGSFNPNEKGRKGHFVLTGDGAIEKFVDASGKEFNVSRIK